MTRSSVSVPGLVGAQHVHSAEILDSAEPFDDHLPAAQGERALRKANGDDHGQHLGRKANSDRHGKEKGASPIVLGESVDEEDERHHQPDHQPGKACKSAIKAGRRRLLCDRASHAAEISVHPYRDYHRRRRAASTLVPMKQVFLISAGEFTGSVSVSWNFSVGSDSPVRLP